MTVKPLYDEKDLLRRIAAADQRAFTILFETYQAYVYAYGRKLTRSDEEAGEIVQEIFLKLWLNREQLPEIENFGAYLNRVVHNHSLNVLRQLARRAAPVIAGEPEETLPDESTQQQLDFNETNRLLHEALGQLSPQQRLAYTLCHVQGMNYADAAAQMHIAASTVRVHLSAALKGIQAHFRKNAVAYPLLIAILFKNF
jgi:RNA polymerase sigma-70 factor (family 1)